MICSSCGTALGPDARFCTACGAGSQPPEEVVCPACSRPWTAGARFCPACGRTAPEPVSAPSDVSPVPPELVATLRTAADACGQALDAFIAEQIDQQELVRRLFAAGVVQAEGEIWFLDLERGCWCRYDGISVAFAETSEGSATDSVGEAGP